MHRIRLTLEAHASPATLISLPKSEAHYVARVLRLQVGDIVEVFDGSGRDWQLRLTQVEATPATVQGELLTASVSPLEGPSPIVLGQGLPKGAKMDTVIEKCSELGLTTLVPLYAERTVVKDVASRTQTKLGRWRRIAEAAARQCGRRHLLEIEPPQTVSAFCRHYANAPAKLLGWEEERQFGVQHRLEALPRDGTLVMLIGPEGGWTPEEVETARSYGFVTASLGPRILRTETAAMTLLALIRYSRGELEPQAQRG